MLLPWKSQGNWDDSICEAIYTHHCCRNLSVGSDGPMLLCPCAVIHDCAPLSPWLLQCPLSDTLSWMTAQGQWGAVMDDCTGTKEHGTIWDHWQISATMVGINSLTDGIISVALWLSWRQHLSTEQWCFVMSPPWGWGGVGNPPLITLLIIMLGIKLTEDQYNFTKLKTEQSLLSYTCNNCAPYGYESL